MHRLGVCDTGSTACGRYAGKTLRNTSNSGHGLECYLFMAAAVCLFFPLHVTIEDFTPFCLSKNPGFWVQFTEGFVVMTSWENGRIIWKPDTGLFNWIPNENISIATAYLVNPSLPSLWELARSPWTVRLLFLPLTVE